MLRVGVEKGKQCTSSCIGGNWGTKGKAFKMYFELQGKEIVHSHMMRSAVLEAEKDFVATALVRRGPKRHVSQACQASPNNSPSFILNYNGIFLNLDIVHTCPSEISSLLAILRIF